MNKNKYQTTSAKGLDPLEIKQEISFDDESIEIKNEPVGMDIPFTSSSIYNSSQTDDKYVLDEEHFDSESESNPLLDQSESYPPGIARIVDINDLLQNKDTISYSNTLSPKREPTSPIPENLHIKIKKHPPCGNCMRNIEHFCTVCKKSWDYHKDTTLCSNCESNLKLQCKICHKRFKFLNKVHQYVLQASKKMNLLSRKKQQVTFTCEKKQNFVCSKCKYQTTQKGQLREHMEKLHGQTVVTNLHKSAAITSDNLTMTTVSDKSINSNLSYLDNLLNTSINMQNLLQEVAEVKVSKKSKKSKKTEIINFNEDDDQYIELFCLECKKTCKKIVYDEIVKPVCRECQKLMWYRCTLCASRYKLLQFVRLHVNRVCWHRMNGPKLNCTHCGYKAEVKSRLEYHIKSEHLPKNCPKCNIEVENAASLKEHLMQCTAVKLNKHAHAVAEPSQEPDLDDVPLIFRRSKLMLKKYLHEKLPIDNDDSYKIIENDPAVLMNEIHKVPLKDNHENGWSSLVDYYCVQCDMETKKKFSKFRPRCPKCKDKYDYRCTSCERLYGGYYSICKHVKHECQNRFEMGCSLCDYTNARKYILLNHIKNKHAIYKCLRCNSRCEGYISLRKHQAIDCNIDNPHGPMHLKRLIALFCKYCHKRSLGLGDNNELVSCERCTMIMNFQCLKCNELFDDQEVTYKHAKEECKPTFLCDKCDYKAYMQYDLDVHVKYVHTFRKCQDCGVQFRDEYIFRLHLKEEAKKKKILNNQLENKVLPKPKKLLRSKKQ
ncbi:hypothetical protein TSAR_010754 [Trichomalopsis sarcophagae]|uniref:C2H2-type domain-containing protein n=1 Tax=Trichomalopsis sarcophagae TaxID=543379 RepID=A0A232EUS2_9HYME|nr:hypothetical protein TSAR_010754 [Trichomalopsis sarcophagae]